MQFFLVTFVFSDKEGWLLLLPNFILGLCNTKSAEAKNDDFLRMNERKLSLTVRSWYKLFFKCTIFFHILKTYFKYGITFMEGYCIVLYISFYTAVVSGILSFHLPPNFLLKVTYLFKTPPKMIWWVLTICIDHVFTIYY